MNKYNVDRTYSYIKGYAMAKGWSNTIKALSFARKSHQNQMRDDGQLYIIHPLVMASHAISLRFDDDAIVATALLHDILEDINGVEASMLPVDDSVIDEVVRLTFSKPKKMKDESYDDYKDRVEESKKIYYGHVARSRIALIVKLLDRVNNVSSMSDSFDKDRLIRYIDETTEYVLPLIRKAKDEYPEYNDQLFCIKYQMDSVIDTARKCIELGSKIGGISNNEL